jgi:hypothetical protein
MKLYRRQHGEEGSDKNEAECVSGWMPECPAIGRTQRTNPLDSSVHPIPQTRRRGVLLFTHPVDSSHWGVVETWVSFVTVRLTLPALGGNLVCNHSASGV